MNYKKLKQLIKQKSDHVEIKDLSTMIMTRYQSEYKDEPIILKSRGFGFTLKSVYALGLLSILLIATLFFFQPSQSLLARDFENNQEEILLSTLSSLNVGLSFNQYTSLEDTLIEQQMPSLQQYLRLMEVISNNPQLALKNVQNPNKEVIRHYQFEAQDLLEVTNLYSILIHDQKRQFRLKTFYGTILIEDESYPFELVINERNQRTLLTKIQLSDAIRIETLFYKEENIKIYASRILENDQVIRSYAIRQSNQMGQKILDLVFNEGEYSSTFRFRRDLNGVYIAYAIRYQETIESGIIGLSVENGQGPKFVMNVRPNGRPDFVLAIQRQPMRQNPNRPNFN